MSAKAKTINLLLYEGDLDGVISIEDSSWNSGELYSAPRDCVSELLETDACKKYGVYLLLSSNMVYVGQSSDLAKRITQHTVGKDWWESVVILTTKDDSLTHSDIDYLESVLIEKAFKINHLDCDNKNKGNNPKVDKFRKVYLGQYLEEALFLIKLIGINVFSETKAGKKTAVQFNTLDSKAKLSLGTRAKKEAAEFLRAQGLSVGKYVTYAKLMENKEAFAMNPQSSLLSKEWHIICNDTDKMELVLFVVPANTFSMKSETTDGLYSRTDKPELIDLKLMVGSYKDKRSEIDFAPFLVEKVSYK